MKVSRLALTVAASLAAFPSLAQQGQNPLAARESQLPAVLGWLQTQGVKLTFLGEEGGLRGYLGESANGKMQTFYVTPDGNHVVAGILFKSGGTNITGVQIGEMRSRFDSASKEISEATVGSPPKVESPVAAPATPAAPAEATPETPGAPAPGPKEAAPAAEAKQPAEAPKAGDKAAGIAVPPPSGPVPGAEGNRSEKWISKIDRTEFLSAVEKAPFFEVGAVSAKTVLWMVADPQCPFCHKTWDHIRNHVYGKKLRVRIIMIAGLPGSEPKAREFLSKPVPARLWLDSDAGRALELKTDQSSPEWAAAGQYLQQNMDLAKRFGVDRTPFLAYVGADGGFYSALGLPTDIDGFLAASGAL